MRKIRPVPRDRPVSEFNLVSAQLGNSVRMLEQAVDGLRHPSDRLVEAVKGIRWQASSMIHLAKRLDERVDDQAREIRLLQKVVKELEGSNRTRGH